MKTRTTKSVLNHHHKNIFKYCKCHISDATGRETQIHWQNRIKGPSIEALVKKKDLYSATRRQESGWYIQMGDKLEEGVRC